MSEFGAMLSALGDLKQNATDHGLLTSSEEMFLKAGECQVFIPENAVEGKVPIKIIELNEYGYDEISPYDGNEPFIRRLAPVLKLEPVNLQFLQPIEIKLPTCFRNTGNSPIDVLVRQKVNGEWKVIDHLKIDPTSSFFTFKTFSSNPVDVVINDETLFQRLGREKYLKVTLPNVKNKKELEVSVAVSDNVSSVVQPSYGEVVCESKFVLSRSQKDVVLSIEGSIDVEIVPKEFLLIDVWAKTVVKSFHMKVENQNTATDHEFQISAKSTLGEDISLKKFVISEHSINEKIVTPILPVLPMQPIVSSDESSGTGSMIGTPEHDSPTESDSSSLSDVFTMSLTLKPEQLYDFIDTTSQTVGTNGGTLTVCGCLVKIPEGACDREVEISITSYYGYEKSTMPVDDTLSDSISRLTPLLKCEPEDFVFKKSIEITLPTCYRNDDESPVSVTIRHKTEDSDWEVLAECLMIQNTRFFSFQTRHFSWFDVICSVGKFLGLMKETAIILAVPPDEEEIVSQILAEVLICDNIESTKDFKDLNPIFEKVILLRNQKHEILIKFSADNTEVDPPEHLAVLEGIRDSWQFLLTRPEGENWKHGFKKVKFEIIFVNPNRSDISKQIFVEKRHLTPAAPRPPTHVTNIEAQDVNYRL